MKAFTVTTFLRDHGFLRCRTHLFIITTGEVVKSFRLGVLEITMVFLWKMRRTVRKSSDFSITVF